eukprot:TRINITY_DN11715_c0_g1_i5.p1 TRINITY_DN11715_c0_g1~~TRINITY_DN11715_c0_g1_i5.p1  ORF type:complete len:213 (+),score=26.71 TRINITY_DN11715_c0_g1_i5:609-1247(+)
MNYEGDFVDGELEGIGKVVFHSGDSYSGSFIKSKFNGYGQYKYSDGLEVALCFTHRSLAISSMGSVRGTGKRHSRTEGFIWGKCASIFLTAKVSLALTPGMMIKSNGSARHGVWEKGIYQKTEQTNNAGCEKVFPIYDGKGYAYSGAGEVEYANGDVYSGELKDGFREGEVVLVGEFRECTGIGTEWSVRASGRTICLPLAAPSNLIATIFR